MSVVSSDAAVLAHMKTTQTAVDEYQLLENQQKKMQILAMAMFIAVALLLLLAAVWFGLAFSEQLVAPCISPDRGGRAHPRR